MGVDDGFCWAGGDGVEFGVGVGAHLDDIIAVRWYERLGILDYILCQGGDVLEKSRIDVVNGRRYVCLYVLCRSITNRRVNQMPEVTLVYAWGWVGYMIIRLPIHHHHAERPVQNRNAPPSLT